MEITTTKKEDCILVAVNGRVDTTTAKEFETHISTVLNEECKNIVLNCENMIYISSSGLRVFLILQKGINAKGGTLVIRGMSEPIKEVFKITGFSSIFNIE